MVAICKYGAWVPLRPFLGACNSEVCHALTFAGIVRSLVLPSQALQWDGIGECTPVYHLTTNQLHKRGYPC
jgi:hypothetical protein